MKGGLKMRLYILTLIFFFFSTISTFSQERLDHTSISFKDSETFITTLSEILKQDFNNDQIKKATQTFKAKSTGFLAISKNELFEKLPIPSEDLILSSRHLELLENPESLTELQNKVYTSAIGVLNSNLSKGLSKGLSLGALPIAALVAAVVDEKDKKNKRTVSISASTLMLEENGGTSEITISLSDLAVNDIIVGLDFDGTATEGIDFSGLSSVLIPAGETSVSFTFSSIDDGVYEGNETSAIKISSINNANFSSSSIVTLTITEDEAIPTVLLETSGNTIAEESGSSIIFTASIDQVSSADLAVTISTIVNSHSRSYTPNIPTFINIIIPAGSLSGTATFTPTDNNSYDGTANVNFAITSISGSGAVGDTVIIPTNGASEIVNITESEVEPLVQISGSSSSVTEGSTAITLTATLSGSTYEETTIILDGIGSATPSLDYSFSNIKIAAGETTGFISFIPLSDDLYEGDETAIVSISTVSGGGAKESGDQSVTVEIIDAESAPTVTLSPSTSSVTEGDSALTMTASLSVATTADVTVTLDTSGTAIEGTDYSNISDIIVSAGSTTGTATFTSIDDNVYEGTETAKVTIGSVSGGSASAASSEIIASISLADDESAPTVSLSSSDTSVKEDGSAITVTVTLANIADEDVIVSLNTSGTATDGTDYEIISDITIPAGLVSGTGQITPIDDLVSEGVETLIVSLGTLSGADATLGSPSGLTLSLIDDDVPNITLSASDISIKEDSTSSLTLTVAASMIATEDIVVTLGAAGTATSGTDYTALPSTVTIAAGETTATTFFALKDDALYDAASDETAIISITNVDGGNALESGDQLVTLTIVDNESAPTVTLTSDVTTVAEDGGTGVLTATLSNATYEDVTVGFDFNGTATAGIDYDTDLLTEIIILAGSTTGTASGTSLSDDLYEGDETAIVSISTVSGGGAKESGDQSVTVEIIDAESAPTVTLSSNVSSLAESGETAIITATLSVATYEDVTVVLDASGTALYDTDYTYQTVITIPAGATQGTASGASIDDDIYEGNETVIITIYNISGGGAEENGAQSEIITIIDNESAPTVTLTSDVTTVAEDGGTGVLTATLSNATYEDVTVGFDFNGTATAGIDYDTDLLTEIIILAGSTTGTASGTSLSDDLYEGDETAIVSISTVSGGGAKESGDQSVTVEIIDAESAPTVTLSSNVSSLAESGETAIITATLSVATYEDVTVVLDASGTALYDTDYTYQTVITIPAGATQGTASGASIDDDIYEGNETVIITIYNISGGGAEENGAQSEIITIIDNESAPTVTLSSNVSSVAESGGTAIITATLSEAVEETVQITLSSGGTSIEGDDYVNLSQIIIGQGDTTGYISLKPIVDTLYENSETAVISIHTISGGGVLENGVQEISLIIIDEELDSGTQAIYNSSNESVWLSAEEFSNSNLYSCCREDEKTSYENINLHKALSYEDENGDPIIGTGKLISIIDSGFQVKGFGNNIATHTEFIGKTILNADPNWFTTYQNNNEHGTAVAGVAAGNFGSGLSMGVAPGANLHLFDYSYDGSYHETWPEYWAEGVRDAAEHGAVVQNNSWGFDDSQSTYDASANITNYVGYMNNNNVSGAQTLSDFYEFDTDQNGEFDIYFYGAPGDWQEYIDALDEFQETGVVVFALSNNWDLGDADVSAALPELFSELKEAWITVASVDISDGDILGKSYWHDSAPCGSTAEYCLAADGNEIFMPGYSDVTDDDGFSYGTEIGTSFAAPQVSGAIALLSSHFPNHSPEALTDRLLASANNNIGEDFEIIGSVTFGNGVVHGYSNEAGHGILDVYAALQPIISSSYTQNQIYAGSNTIGKSSFNLNFSTASISRSFGDAIEIGLANTNTYFYDALDGGFAVGMNDLTFSLNPAKPSLSVKFELSKLTSVSNKFLHFENTGWSESSDDRKGFFNASVSSSPSALNNFYLNAGAADLGFASYSMPTLSGIQGGDGFNLGLNIGEGFLTTSFTQTNISNNLDNEVQSSFITSYQQEISKDLTYSLMFGLADEGSKFLGMTGDGAFDLEGSKSNTALAGAKVRFGVGEMSSIGLMAAISKSELSENNQGFVTGIDNVTADTFALSFDTFNVFGNDKLSISMSQPHRVNSGTMGMQIAGLADSDGNIPYTYHDISLTPSGRQVDLSIEYSKDISENATIGARFIHTKEAGHVKSAQDENSIFAGIKYKNLNLGGSYVDVSNRVEAEINYTISW